MSTKPRWDLGAPYSTWDLLDLIAYIDHWRDECAALTSELVASEAEWQAESDARDKDFADCSAAIAERDATIERLMAASRV